MSAPFRWIYRIAQEFIERFGAIPDKAVAIFNGSRQEWDIRPLQPDDVGAAPASHTHSVATATDAGFMSSADKAKLDSIEAGAQVNQDAFSSVRIGSTTITAQSPTDTLELAAGANITLVPDTTNRKVTISASGGGGGSSSPAFSTVRVGATDVTATAPGDVVELVAGSNVTLTPDATAKTITIAASGGGSANSFGLVQVGSTSIPASSPSDTLKLASGSNIELIPDTATKQVTVAVSPQGDGSGLDADTLDGAHASDFAPAAHTHTEYAPVDHTHDGVYAPLAHSHPVATSSSAGFMSAQDKSKLDGVQAGAEVNQNAYSAVRVGDTTIPAQSKTDTLELVAGSNVTLVPDAANRKVTILAAGGSTSPSFSKVRVGSTDIEASVPGDTVTVEGLGEVAATADTANKKVQLYVPSRPSFSRVRVGATEVQASGPQDVLELVSGSGISLTPDTANKAVTVAVNPAGLNADTVDGQHASAFAPASHQHALGVQLGFNTSSVTINQTTSSPVQITSVSLPAGSWIVVGVIQATAFSQTAATLYGYLLSGTTNLRSFSVTANSNHGLLTVVLMLLWTVTSNETITLGGATSNTTYAFTVPAYGGYLLAIEYNTVN